MLLQRLSAELKDGETKLEEQKPLNCSNEDVNIRVLSSQFRKISALESELKTLKMAALPTSKVSLDSPGTFVTSASKQKITVVQARLPRLQRGLMQHLMASSWVIHVVLFITRL